MLLLFLIFFLNAEIPDRFKDLAKRAIKNSQTKIAREERFESATPGDYNFESFKFTLKRTCTSPFTNDLKGFAIDNSTSDVFIAIVKRKKFNLPEDFTFLVPNEEQVFQMTSVVASDNNVLIYNATELTIFDIMTNFELNRKTKKGLALKIPVFWNMGDHEPLTWSIPGVPGVRLGCGGMGKFSAGFKVKFKHKHDLMIQATLKIEIELGILAKLKEMNYFSTHRNVLASIEVPIPGLSYYIRFLGIKFGFGVNALFESSIDRVVLQIPQDFRIFKGYKYTGKKTITVTNFRVTDSPWQITKTRLPDEKSNLQVQQYFGYLTAHILTVFKLALVARIHCLGIRSSLEVGLKLPINVMMDYNADKCLYPYATVGVDFSLNMYYYFSGIKVKILWKKIRLIRSSGREIPLFTFGIPKSCINKAGQAVEGSPGIMHFNYSRSYLVENYDFHWETGNPGAVQLVIEGSEQADTRPQAIRMFPYQGYSVSKTNPTPLHSFLMVTTNSPPRIKWYFNINVALLTVFVKKKKKWYGKTKKYYYYYWYNVEQKSSLYTFAIDDSWPVSTSFQSTMIHGNNLMKGNSTVWFCRNVSRNMVYTRENNSMVITEIPDDGQKRVLLSLDKSGNSTIDETAQFYAESMTNDMFMTTGYYGNRKKKSHYDVYWEYFNSNVAGLTLNINLTLQMNANGRTIQQPIGRFSVPFGQGGSFSAKDKGYENYHMKIYAPYDSNPSIIMSANYAYDSEVYSVSAVANRDCIYNNQCNAWNINNFFYIKANFKPMEKPLVTIKTSKNNDNEVIIDVQDVELDDIVGNFTVDFGCNQSYKAINITNSEYQLKDRYLILKNDDFTPITPDMVKLSNNIYAIHSTKDYITLPIRRTVEEQEKEFTFEYLITNVNNIENMNFNEEGEVLNFTDTNESAISFIMPLVDDEYYLFIDKPNDFTYYSMDFDNDSKILTVLPNTNESEVYTLLNSYAIIEKEELSTIFNSSLIEKLLTKEYSTYNVTVICRSDDVKSIRCGSRVQDLIDGKTVFTFERSGVDEIEFFAVCKDDTGVMCEITFIPQRGDYHLFYFPSSDGINVSGRGMEYALIHAKKGEHVGYYKNFNESIKLIKSYDFSTDINIIVNDFYPGQEDQPLVQEETGDEDEGDYELADVDDNETLADDYVMSHPYRRFCIYDKDGNLLPLSANLISEDMDSLMASMGAPYFTILDYNITYDGCIQINLEAIQTNEINTSFFTNLVDIKVNKNSIKVNTSGMSYIPPQKEKKSDNHLIIPIVIGTVACAAALACIAIFSYRYYLNRKLRVSNEADEDDSSNLDQNDPYKYENNENPYDQNANNKYYINNDSSNLDYKKYYLDQNNEDQIQCNQYNPNLSDA